MSTLYRSTFIYKGKRYERTSTVSADEADRKAAKLKQDLENGVIGISNNMTVRRWANEWLETYKKPILTQKSYNDYVSMFNNIILPAIGAMRVTDVLDIHLQKILNAKQGYSLSRMKKLKERIHAMFEQARAARLIMYNPAEFIKMPKAVAGSHRCITDHERMHFLKVAETHYAGLMFKVMLYCGLRTGEVVALDWQDINIHKKRLKITKAMESGTSTIKEPKTKAGNREVPIPDGLFADLMSRMGDPFGPIFLQPRGNVRHTHSSRRKAWESLKNQIDISMGACYKKMEDAKGITRRVKTLSLVADDFVPYCLRHTYCTDLQTKGVPINIAKYLMGHSDIKVTASIYTHMSEKALDEAANLINCVSACVSSKSAVKKTAS